jgi:hypothetical protein
MRIRTEYAYARLRPVPKISPLQIYSCTGHEEVVTPGVIMIVVKNKVNANDAEHDP